ncbi:MAG TPA: trypsin-like peptidase domain-containing protein [Longimicrobium sp.]|nr:trypsin-like peptidase domain-containing protein [Longimicrobium sp.]
MMCSRALPRLALVALAGLAPSVAQAQNLTPREIAAAAQRATVQIRALDSRGEVDGLGSGFLVSPDGVIVTNFHVIQHAHALQVETFDGEVYDNVYYVTADPRRDVAVLKVPVEGAVSLRLGSDTAAVVGAEVYAMGHPLGQTSTFTDGLVSANRTVEGVSMIQISAPISPGSSGGPVMDGRGEVIGVATMVLAGGQNLNYAVPVRYVRPLLGTGDPPQRFARSLLPRASGGLASVGERPSARPGSSRVGERMPPRSASGGSRWEEQVIGFLEMGEEMLEGEGFARTHEYETGTLGRGASETVRIRLDAGVTYMLLGACDTDCDDVDLKLLSPRGTLLDSDTASDDFPVLTVTPSVSGEYTVRVTMARCDTSVCYYSLGVYGSQ